MVEASRPLDGRRAILTGPVADPAAVERMVAGAVDGLGGRKLAGTPPFSASGGGGSA